MIALLLLPLAVARDDGTCGAWRAAEALGQADDADLTEVSGLAVSHQDAGLLWLHNDHGGDASLHAATLSGEDSGRYEIIGAENHDWEDLSLGPCPAQGTEPCSCLYLADIGDNDLERDGGEIMRFAEPAATGAGAWSQITPLDMLSFTWPDGPHDAETLLVHPETGEVLVLTKGETTGVYAFSTIPPIPAAEPDTLTLVTTFALAEAGAEDAEVTGGAVSPRGYRVVLRTDADLALFTGSFGASLEETLRQDPVLLPTPPPGAGEAAAWSPDGRRIYLVGEGEHPDIHAVDCAAFTPDGEDSWDPLVDCVPGCGCASGGRTGAGWALLALVSALGLRRRSERGHRNLPHPAPTVLGVAHLHGL
jgi:MYXO-CTERM domain-containing protein